jgi:hypothetical protein
MVTVPMAVQDFVPVLTTTVALAMMARILGDLNPRVRSAAIAGVALVGAGGVAKATWKLTLAATGANIVVLDRALFWLLAPGFLLLVVVVASHLRSAPGPGVAGTALWATGVWGVGATVAAAAGLDAARLVLLGIATTANLALALLAMRWSRQAGVPAAAWLFAATLALVVVLNGLARSSDPSAAAQWLHQGTNTVAQALFLFATIGLTRAVRAVQAQVESR